MAFSTPHTYVVGCRVMSMPAAASIRDYLFVDKATRLLETNHDDQLVFVEREDAAPIPYSYDELRKDLRHKYRDRTVFPIVTNRLGRYRPLRSIKFEHKWMTGVDEQKGTYFFGDSPRAEKNLYKKEILMGVVSAICVETSMMVKLNFIVETKEEEDLLLSLVMNQEDVFIDAAGMQLSVTRGERIEHWMLVGRAKFVVDDYADLATIVPFVNSCDDVCVWRDFKSGKAVPTVIEQEIIAAAFFFMHEGFATFNLDIVGGSGTGKTFLFDALGELSGSKVHAMEQTTIKGLVYSHAEKGGQQGVLFREPYVALLSEYMRIAVRTITSAKQKDDISRLLSSLNDAVERKGNRARSSGNVVDGVGQCTCSVMMNDNDYDYLIRPLFSMMLEDASYFRRYSYLKLSKEAELNGKRAKVGVMNWRASLKQHMIKKSLGGGRWMRVMRFWRSQVKDAINSFEVMNIVRFAEIYKQRWIQKLFKKHIAPVSSLEMQTDTMSVPTKMAYDMLQGSDFAQLAAACAYSSIIMGSTYRTKSGLPALHRSVEDDQRAARMFMRLMDDMFTLLHPVLDSWIQERQGVQRSSRFGDLV